MLIGSAPPGIIVPAAGPQPRPYPGLLLPNASDAAGDGLLATTREAAACVDAGAGPRFYALHTNDFLRRAFARGEPGAGQGAPVSDSVSAGLPR